MFLEVATSVFFIWLIWYILTTCKERRGMPPGPFPLPFIGNLNQMGTDVVSSFDKLWEKYGDIYTVTFPIGNVVVINSVELAREAMLTRKDDMAGRLPGSIYPINIIFGKGDVVSSDYGPALVFRRKVFKSALHIFGTGVEQAEERMGYAVQNLLKEIEAMEGRPFLPHKYVSSAIISQLWKWVSSKECLFGHPSVNSLLEFNKKVAALCEQGTLHQFIPFLTYLPTTFNRNLKDVIRIKEDVFVPELKVHRETYTSGTIRDLTDSFLNAYMNEIEKGTAKDIGSIEDVESLMVNVFNAGSHPTSSFISWFILYMVVNEDVQKKIHAELDRVVGRDRLPSSKDIPNLHYLQATICEVMRHSSFTPISLPHSAIRDTTIKGYRIPKGTTVLLNIYRFNRDLKQWPDAWSFEPDRFLDEDGMFIGWTKFPGFLPFGIGRRACAGETLAKIQVSMFTSNLLHRFKFESAGEVRPTLEPAEASLVLWPKDYKIAARKRE